MATHSENVDVRDFAEEGEIVGRRLPVSQKSQEAMMKCAQDVIYVLEQMAEFDQGEGDWWDEYQEDLL